MSAYRYRVIPVLCFLACVFILALSADSGAAEYETGPNGGILVFDAEVFGAIPDWTTLEAMEADSEIRAIRREDTTILQFVPRGTDFEDWGTLFGISASRIPGISKDLKGYAEYAVANYEAIAGKQNFTAKVVARGANFIGLLLLLERTPNAPENLTVYSRDIGQISLMHISVVKDTVVTVYQSWRGPAFDRNKPDTWPVGAVELDGIFPRFNHVRSAAAAPAARAKE
ncbi:MAG: hypothetical protein VYB54_00490 [Pseudomonadota bacterium]|nr:hypothetical protein [Pseudomonadota bacterium]